MNFVFIGGTYRGYALLKSLIEENYAPSFCFVLKEDEHENLQYSLDITLLLQNLKIPYKITKKINPSDIDNLHEKEYDFAIVCGWRTLILEEIQKKFTHGMIAAHDSLLPKYRGFAPLNWSIINGERETGVTLFVINENEVDSGKIISQKKVPINITDYAIDVYEKITDATVYLYKTFISNYLKGSISYKIQNEEEATYTCKRCPDDGKINWEKDSLTIYNLIRGLAYPYPGAFFYYNEKRYYVKKANIGLNDKKKYVGKIIGRVIKITSDYVEILCGEGTIAIEEIGFLENNTIHVIKPNTIIKSLTNTLK